jgi:hypothetical protein
VPNATDKLNRLRTGQRLTVWDPAGYFERGRDSVVEAHHIHKCSGNKQKRKKKYNGQ